MPRARQAPELSDRCAPRLAFPETGPTRAPSSFRHDCVQQALRFDCSDDDHGKVPRRKRAEKAGRSKPSDLDEVRNQLSARALAFVKPVWCECRRRGKSRPDMRSWLRARRGHAGSSGKTARQKSSFRWLQSTVSRRFVTTKLGASCASLPAERARLVQRRRRPLRSCWRGISKLRTSASTRRTPCKCAAYAVAPDPTRPPSGFVCCRKRSSPSHGSSESSLIRRSAALRRMKRATRRRSRRRKRPC
jgi:hypothetical protein